MLGFLYEEGHTSVSQTKYKLGRLLLNIEKNSTRKVPELPIHKSKSNPTEYAIRLVSDGPEKVDLT